MDDPAPIPRAPLYIAGGALVLGCMGLFAVFHYTSVGHFASNPITADWSYWSWVRENIGRDELMAVQTSPEGLDHALFFAAALAVVTAAYLALLRHLRTSGRALPIVVVIVAVACAGWLLIAPTMQSADVYVYVMLGRMQVIHEANPYLHRVGDFPGDRFHGLLHFPEEVAPYGQVVMATFNLVTRVAESTGADLAAYLWAYKLLATLLHLANGLLIFGILRRWGGVPPAWGAAAYLLNPLCLIEFAGSAHNDVIGLFWLLLALLMYSRDRRLLTAAALGLAVLSKIYLLPVVALYLVGLMRERGRGEAIRAVSILVAVGAACVIPYYGGLESVTTFLEGNHTGKFVNSLAEVAEPALGRRPLQIAGLALVLLTWLIGAWRTTCVREAVVFGGWYAFVGVTLGAGWFWPWYAIVPLVLAVVSASEKLRRVALLLTLCAPVMYVIFALGGPRSPHPGAAWLYRYKPLVVFLPCLLLAGWYGVGLLRRRVR